MGEAVKLVKTIADEQIIVVDEIDNRFYQAHHIIAEVVGRYRYRVEKVALNQEVL